MVMATTHPRHPPAKDGDVVIEEPPINGFPNKASPDHGGARRRIICYLRELSHVDVDSLCGGEPGIRGVATTHHLRPSNIGIIMQSQGWCGNLLRREFL